MLFILFSISPSFAFLIALLHDVIKVMMLSETDKQFEKIVSNEEDMENEDPELINVAIMDDKAYWIHNNTFYMADIVDDEVDKNTSRPVDAMQMSLYEINKMLFIVDHLNEG
jgi:hypothetical protein